MKIKLLLMLCCFTILNSFSQTQTITIPWDFFAVPPEDPAFGDDSIYDTNITIEVGDTVVWEWVTVGPQHNVKSQPGSVETFGTPGDENATFSAPYSFSHTFTVLGVSDFICTPHETLMYGSVTVVPEGTLSNETFSINNFSISPNPANKNLNITLPASIQNSSVEIYNVLGKRILEYKLQNTHTKNIDVSSLNSGVYLVRVSNNKSTYTKRFVKQ